MTPDQITALFTRADGQYLFARWGRPIAPVAFGVEDATIATLKGAVEALCQLAGHEMADTDPELGSNLMIFFLRDWQELAETPNLDRLIPDLDALLPRLQAVAANQYRAFRFDEAGAIKAAFVFIRMDDQMSSLPAETIALAQMAQTMVLWSDTAFSDKGPLARVSEDAPAILRPDIANVIRAAYDPVLPAMSQDASHALRLAARISAAN